MFKSIKERTLLICNRGSVAAEAAIWGVVLTILLAFVVDLGSAQLRQGQLTQLSYSLATVLRERTALYQGEERVTQAEFKTLHMLAKTLMKNISPDDVDNLSMSIEYAFFQGIDVPIYNPLKSVSFVQAPAKNDKCLTKYTSGDNDIRKLASLSPYSVLERWMPVYRVTLCIENRRSSFLNIMGLDDKFGGIAANSMVVPR